MKAAVLEVGTRFDAANRPEEYAAVRALAHARFGEAMLAGEANVAAALMLLAAESAYFVARDPEVPSADRAAALLTSLTELSALGAWPFAEGDPRWGGRFMSLATSTALMAARHDWQDPEEKLRVTMALAQLAARLDRAMPPGVELHIDPERGPDVMADVAWLSSSFGIPAVAVKRVETMFAVSKRPIEALVRLLHAARRADDATAHEWAYRMLAEQVVTLRERYRSRAGRLWLAGQLDDRIGAALVEPRIKAAHDARDMFDVAELVKARLLGDDMDSAPTPMADAGARQTAKAAEDELMRFAPRHHPVEPGTAYAELPLVSRLPIGQIDPRSPRAHADAVKRVEAMFAAAGNAGYGKSTGAVRAEEVMALLADDELLVQYFLPYQDLEPSGSFTVVALTRTKVRAVTLDSLEPLGSRWRSAVDGASPLDFSMYTSAVANLRAAIRREDDQTTEEYARRLYDWLIGPVVELGFDPAKFSRLILVPHSVFHAVPFAALRSPQGPYLVESTALTTVPSAGLWARQVRRERRPISTLLAVENPAHGDPALADLGGAAREIRRVRAATAKLEQTHLDGPRATESAVRQALPGKGIVHIAAHGEFPEVNALDLHRIRLGADTAHDGRLLADELRSLDLRATRLCVLSVCDGGIYRFGPGDEPYGLLPALFAAGVENVLGALWPVHDELGAEFMIELYKHVLEAGPAEAVRRACRTFIADGARPLYWAAFALSGPGRAIA